MIRALVMTAMVLGACGCALTSRGAPLSVRYYSPEPPPARLAAPAEAQGPATRPVIRLGRVRGAPDLRERIAHRESKYEIGFYDDRQWTERPDAYVRRALVRKLFEERGFERAVGGFAPTLDVELVGFEEIRMPRVHAARVKIYYQLRNDTSVFDQRTVTVDHPVSGPRFADFVEAISRALDEASDRIADQIARAWRP